LTDSLLEPCVRDEHHAGEGFPPDYATARSERS
jgi:hypothetical protein